VPQSPKFQGFSDPDIVLTVGGSAALLPCLQGPQILILWVVLWEGGLGVFVC
jgi:hypothetical protein